MKCVISFVYFALLIESKNAALRPRIIGGENADIKSFPYQASLRVRGSHICGGAIVSYRHILTAAHCINSDFVPPYGEVSVSTGTSSSNTIGNSHRVATVTVHPRFTGTHESLLLDDIAVITLAGEIKFNELQQKIDLASKDVASGSKAILTGWGSTNQNLKPSAWLQKLQMTLLNDVDCRSQYPLYKLYKEQLCAYHGKGYGSSSGDSGGPLVMDNQLVGIVSWIINGNCAIGTPEVYTNIYAYRYFIESVLSKN